MLPARNYNALALSFLFICFSIASVTAQNESVQIVIISEDKVADLRQRMIITCVAFGSSNSNISITWQKDNEIIDTSGVYCLADRQIEQGIYRFKQSFLQITELECFNEGVYTCSAGDGNKNVTSTVTIRLMSSVSLVGSSEVVTAYEGGDAQLVCVAYSPNTDNLTFIWSSNGIEIASSFSTIIKEDHFTFMKRHYTMSILHRCHQELPLTVEDNSKFLCKAHGMCTAEATIDLIVFEDPLLFQLKLRLQSGQCQIWRTALFTNEITNIVFDAVRTRCDCYLGSQTIISKAKMVCFDESPGFIYYRAQLNGTRGVSVDDLIQDIDYWVQTSPFISVQEQLLSVQPDCTVHIASFDTPPCSATDSATGISSQIKPEVTSAIVLVVTFVIGSIVAIVIVVLLRHKASIARTEAIYKYVDSYQLHKFEGIDETVYEDVSNYQKDYDKSEPYDIIENDAYNKVYEKIPMYENYEKINLTSCDAYERTGAIPNRDYEPTADVIDISQCIAYEPTKTIATEQNDIYERIDKAIDEDDDGCQDDNGPCDSIHPKSVGIPEPCSSPADPTETSEERNLLKSDDSGDVSSSSEDVTESTTIETEGF